MTSPTNPDIFSSLSLTQGTCCLIASLDSIESDPRPRRLQEFLQARQLTVESISPAKTETNAQNLRLSRLARKVCRRLRILTLSLAQRVAIIPTLRIKLFDRQWGGTELIQHLEGSLFDVVFVESFQLLPAIRTQFPKAKLVLDAREYYPLQREDWRFRALEKSNREFILHRYLPQCDYVVTVSPGLRRRYESEYPVRCELFRSTPWYVSHTVNSVDPSRIRLVYHGVANANRDLGRLIETVPLLDQRYSLHLFLTGNPTEIQRLKRLARREDRVVFHQPVPIAEIPRMLQEFDIGLAFFPTDAFNLRHCLPNKFFEYIQARLMVAVGPSPDMAEIVNLFKLGLVTSDAHPLSLAKQLNVLSPEDIYLAKTNAHAAAKELCLEREVEKVLRVPK